MLVVDLDGALLKSDIVYENFWSAFSKDWRVPILSVSAFIRGKTELRSYLISGAEINISTLPYDTVVVDYIRSYKLNGGSVALVTNSSQTFAEKINGYLQIFDEVFGSNDLHNLEREKEVGFLIERFGREKFIYMSDKHKDIPIWKISKKIVTVNAPSSLQKKTETLGKPFEHLVTSSNSFSRYLKAMRPHQWFKNILIFLPMLAAHQIDTVTMLNSVIAFFSFCLVASSVYIVNDLLDLSSDRVHPRKYMRPFASGSVPLSHGGYLAVFSLLSGMIIAALFGWIFFLTLCLYYALTLAYSVRLKRKIVLDIFVLAGLYTMRVIVGGVVTGIELSVWLLAFSIFLFLSLAAVKRQAELVDMVEHGTLKSTGRGYHVEDLQIISMVGLTSGYLSVLVLALYLNSPAVQQLYGFPYALWAICFFLLYWLTRIILITHRGLMHDDPIIFATKDRVSQACFVLMLGCVLAGALL